MGASQGTRDRARNEFPPGQRSAPQRSPMAASAPSIQVLLGAAGDADEGVREEICKALVHLGAAQPALTRHRTATYRRDL